MIDTLAAAFRRIGRLLHRWKWQSKAIELLKDDKPRTSNRTPGLNSTSRRSPYTKRRPDGPETRFADRARRQSD